MTTRSADISPRIYARLAGFLYLLVVPLGIFGALYVPSRMIVPGDASATANNLMASESLFRLGIVSDLLASPVPYIGGSRFIQVTQTRLQNFVLLLRHLSA